MAISFIRSPIRKEKGMTIISHKENHPVIPKEVVTVVDLGYLGIDKDFPEQLSALPCKKKRNLKIYCKKKKSITNFILKEENSDRAYYHLSIKKVQDTCRCI